MRKRSQSIADIIANLSKNGTHTSQEYHLSWGGQTATPELGSKHVRSANKSFRIWESDPGESKTDSDIRQLTLQVHKKSVSSNIDRDQRHKTSHG